MTLQALALWATIGALLNVAGYPWDSWQFWCFMGCFWAVHALALTQGRVQGIIDYLDMNEREQQRIKQALKEARKD